jgi:hypothetical protein
MSQARSKLLAQVALYAQNHTSIDPYDAIAFYASMATPADFPHYLGSASPKSITSAFERVVAATILDLKAKHPEEIEGAYSAALQAAWDDDRRGCGQSYLSGYIADAKNVLRL